MLTTRYNNVVLLITMKKYSQQILKISFITAILFLVSTFPNKALADPLEDKSDAMSRLGSSTAADVPSDHTIQFVTPTGVDSGETIVITFESDFDGSNHTNGALDFSDVDLLIDDVKDGVCDGTSQTLVDSAPGVSEWSAVFSGTENRVLTLTSGGASATVGDDYEVCIMIGQNATGGTANSQYINPTTTGVYTISMEAGLLDTGDIVVSIIENDVVVITARVNETITFAISDYDIGFGVLSLTNARFATGTDGTDGPTPVSAHSMGVATNGTSGYDLTYKGLTLMSGTDDIDPATIVGSEDGTPGSEQFAIGFSTSDDATVVAAYLQPDNYSFVEDTETQIAYETAPTATETISAFYLANISGLTPAGTYSTAITYVASANF